MTDHVLPLDTKNAELEVVGGKGRSLAEMVNAGLDVPDGFYLTTAAYRHFVSENDLQAKIIELAKPVIGEYTLSFDAAIEPLPIVSDESAASNSVHNSTAQAPAVQCKFLKTKYAVISGYSWGQLPH